MLSQLVSRLCRTALLSSILAASVAAHADEPTPKLAQAAQPDTWSSVTTLLDANDKKLDKIVTSYLRARRHLSAKEEGSGTEIGGASYELAKTREERAALIERRVKTTRPAGPAVTRRLEDAEAKLARAEADLFAALDEEAHDDTEFKFGTEVIERAHKALVTARAKVNAERAKANRRPKAKARPA